MAQPGDMIAARYRLDRLVDEGGMATVWRATHVDLGHPVAVKFNTVRGPGADQAADRFLREARVAAAVRHRNVVDVIDFGLTDDRAPYIVMEFLEGVNLGDRLGMRPPLHVYELGQILTSTLRGLAAVHEAGIVHRDVKPENIFLLRDADGEFPKLLDFGISRTTDAAPALRSSVPTVEGLLVGTPEYMSPEQARGLKDVDSRTDLYSLGVVAYEALTGRLPFETENVGDLLFQITTGVAQPLSAFRPDLGQPLSDWIERAMARQRDARFADARAMLVALEEALQTTARVATNWNASVLPSPGGGLPLGTHTPSPDAGSDYPTLGPGDAVPAMTPAAFTSTAGGPLASGIEPMPLTQNRRAGLWVVGLSAALAAAVGIGLAARPSEATTGTRAPHESSAAPPSAPAPAADLAGTVGATRTTTDQPAAAQALLADIDAGQAVEPEAPDDRAVAEPITPPNPRAARRATPRARRPGRRAGGRGMGSMAARMARAPAPFSDPGF